MVEIDNKSKCCGCHACFNICPKNAIRMEIDDKGFKYPIIDENKCINCGLCKKTCPILNNQTNTALNECYVGYAKDDEYKENASSGGIFPTIANFVLNNNGIVIGAAFDDNNSLNHIAITKHENLIKLKGSKYLQSNLNNIFLYVKEHIEDKMILFVGTPCQVAGLKSFLKKDYDNLICIDLICHGVPSTKLFNKYVEELEHNNNDKLINYNFRDKVTGWDTYSVTATFNKSKITQLSKDNDYMKLFLSDIALRESCYNCNFKLGNKYSDITLGDFWGINNYYPEMYNKKGVSAIIINTVKGKEILNNITEMLDYKSCKLEEILAGNPSLKSSSKQPKNREKFFKDIESIDISELTKKYYKNNKFYYKLIRKIKGIIKNKILVGDKNN